MEFWCKEVKPGTTVSCKVGAGYVIHLSQAALGETKKGGENVIVSVKVGDKKLVIGTLSFEKHPQIMCDLVFDSDFELSHRSKTTSVFFTGYKSELPDMFESDSSEDEELETDEIPMKDCEIKKSAAKVTVKDGKKDKQDDDDDETSSGDDDFSDDSDSEMSEDDESSGEDEVSTGTDDLSDGSEDENDDSEEEETPTLKKPEGGKKRTSEVALKTPVSDKKAKREPSGQKTGDKKGAHVATPHPAKQTSKTPAKTPAGDKKSKSPKSGSHACKSCNKTFGSESALESHQKAKKHEG